MNPLLKRHFSNFKQRYDIEVRDDVSENERMLQQSKAFEKFVNSTIFSLEYPEIYNGDASLLNLISIGGGNDTGIDGLGIVVNDIIVRSPDDINLILAEKNKKIEYDFVFIQSKMQSNFDASEFNTFSIGVEHFLSKIAVLPENEKIKDFRIIKDMLDSDEVNKRIRRNPNLYLYYISTGNAPTDKHFQGTKGLIEKKFNENNYYFNEVSVKLIDGKTLIGFCDELENNFQVKINILDTFPLLVGGNEEIKKAHVFTCTASEYLKILTKEDGSLRKHLFSDNVRDYLGNKEGSVNSEIEKSILNDPEMFLLCNNGVTIVCSDFNPIKDKLVQIDNPQIVNGCQTSTSIFKQKDHHQIGDVKLLVRLICTENFVISNKIVRGTNKQNQVFEETFETTLPFHQDSLEPFFLAMDTEPKLYYERRTKQYNESSIKKTQIINFRLLAQAFTAIFLNAPHDSYRHEKIILENYGGEKWQRKIFRDDHSEFPYYLSAAIWCMIDKYFYKEQYKKYETYRNHVCLIFLLSFGTPPKLSKGYKIENYCKKILEALSGPQISGLVDVAFKKFDEITKLWIKQGGSRFGIKDNKAFTELLLKSIQSVEEVDGDLKKAEFKYTGKILRLVEKEKGLWHCFIESDELGENIYFDSRSFKGNPKTLTTGKKVRFDIMTTKKARSVAVAVELE
ncbi:AIPR family protein [Sphingobacterium multivorum]|uniref:AIPR family protein n=1 Tax=Sphingobacterium multivorum TaxID=28454 RepID=UPI0019196371|nr:AIPR family protein [Sphingobacterium multivorum]QQT61927.1 AIPR family protein [Sphingobacterium multivorum]